MEQFAAYLSKNSFNIDRQVSMGAAVSSDYAETQSVWSSAKSDGLILRWADGKIDTVGDCTEITGVEKGGWFNFWKSKALPSINKIVNDPPLDIEKTGTSFPLIYHNITVLN